MSSRRKDECFKADIVPLSEGRFVRTRKKKNKNKVSAIIDIIYVCTCLVSPFYVVNSLGLYEGEVIMGRECYKGRRLLKLLHLVVVVTSSVTTLTTNLRFFINNIFQELTTAFTTL